MRNDRVGFPRRRFIAAVTCPALWVLALGGCGKPATPPAAPAPATSTLQAPASVAQVIPAPVSSSATTPAPAASATPAATIEVMQLTLGTAVDAAHRITAPGTRFAQDAKTLYASVDTRGQTAKATLNARWRYLEGDGQLISSISQSIAADGPATTTFTLHNPDLWPEGKYRIEIFLDDAPVIQRDFEIGKP
jgi:hypothetical protein